MDQWVTYVVDVAILLVIALAIMIAIFVKRNRYQREAETCIRAEIQLPTGWSKYYVVECDPNDKTISVENFLYALDPKNKRFGRHPLVPFMGLRILQVPIRVETWALDNPNPLRVDRQQAGDLTSMEIKAMTREIQAAAAAMHIQEIDERQQELTKTIMRIPDKIIVYVLCGAAAVFSLIGMVIIAQLGDVI